MVTYQVGKDYLNINAQSCWDVHQGRIPLHYRMCKIYKELFFNVTIFEMIF